MEKKFTFLILLALIFAFWIFWLPGARVANDYHLPQYNPLSEEILPWIWRETNVADGLGEYTGVTLWSQPIHSFFGILSAFSVSSYLQTKFLGALVLIVGFFSLSKLLRLLEIEGIGKHIGILFFLTNSYFLLLFDGGQLSLALTYAIFPLAFYLFLKMIDKPKFKYKLFLAISALCISILDIRFVYLLLLIFLIRTIFHLLFLPTSKRLNFIKNIFLSGGFVAIILIGFHFYWMLPSVLVKQPQLPQTYERASQVDFLSFSSIGHSLLLQQPHWYKNIFGKVSNLNYEFILIPILVFLAPILRKKDKIVGFWLVIAALGIFLSKGSQEPFRQIYPWLFTHIPGFSLFRDPTKFYFFISLAYSILIAITMQEILSRKGKLMNNILRVTPFLVLIYFVWLIRPVYLGGMTGLLSQPAYESEYSKLDRFFKDDNHYSRIFWIPTKAPLGHASNIHPPVAAARLSKKRPFAAGVEGTYETFNFLREAPYMSEIFDVAGIGYIAYPPLDKRRDDMHPDNIRYYDLFLDQLSKLPWLSRVTNSTISLLKTDHHQEKFFITSNIWWVIGSDSIYNESTKSADLKLTKNALIFSDEYPGLGNKLDRLSEAKLVLNNKTKLDLAASFINPTNLIFPAKNLDFAPNYSGWWKREAADLVNWRAFLQTKYGIDNQDFDLGGGWAVGEGSLKLKARSEKLKVDQVLLARVLESTRSGELVFKQEGEVVGKIETKKEGNNVKWFEVGELLENGGELEIKSEGDINVVNALAVLDKNEWVSYQDKANKLRGRIVNFDEKNAQNENTPIVTYQKLNPTKYIVNISGLTKPEFLVFSQNYDRLWKINDQTPLPVYSLLNGFRVERDGQYVVEFAAQKYVYIGLIVSGLTVLILIYLLFRNRDTR